VITWKDFILDDFFGPTLVVPESSDEDCRETRLGSASSIKEDARSKRIQETRQEQRPARMVGLGLGSSTLCSGKEANRSSPIAISWHRRGEAGGAPA
jgi:hypothetical protein